MKPCSVPPATSVYWPTMKPPGVDAECDRGKRTDVFVTIARQFGWSIRYVLVAGANRCGVR